MKGDPLPNPQNANFAETVWTPGRGAGARLTRTLAEQAHAPGLHRTAAGLRRPAQPIVIEPPGCADQRSHWFVKQPVLSRAIIKLFPSSTSSTVGHLGDVRTGGTRPEEAWSVHPQRTWLARQITLHPREGIIASCNEMGASDLLACHKVDTNTMMKMIGASFYLRCPTRPRWCQRSIETRRGTLACWIAG